MSRHPDRKINDIEGSAEAGAELPPAAPSQPVKPAARVNGRPVKEGDVFSVGAGNARAEYRVLRIEARRIVIERDGIELEVTMD